MKSRPHLSADLNTDDVKHGSSDSDDPGQLENTDRNMPSASQTSTQMLSSDKGTSDEPGGLTLSEIKKLLRSRNLDPKHISKKVTRLMKSRLHHSVEVRNGFHDAKPDKIGDPGQLETTAGQSSRIAPTAGATILVTRTRRRTMAPTELLHVINDIHDNELTATNFPMEQPEFVDIENILPLKPKVSLKQVPKTEEPSSDEELDSEGQGSGVTQENVPREPNTEMGSEGSGVSPKEVPSVESEWGPEMTPKEVPSAESEWDPEMSPKELPSGESERDPEMSTNKVPKSEEPNVVSSFDTELSSVEPSVMSTHPTIGTSEESRESSSLQPQVQLPAVPESTSSESTNEVSGLTKEANLISAMTTTPAQTSMESLTVTPEQSTIMASKPSEESAGSTESDLLTEEPPMLSSGSTNAAQTDMESLTMTPEMIPEWSTVMASKPDEESTGSAESDLTTEEPPIVSSTNAPEIEDAIHEEQTEDAPSTQKRYAPGYPNGFQHDEQSKRNAKMNSQGKPFAVPASDVRWTGITMAHSRSHDGAVNTRKAKTKKKKKQNGSDGISMVVNMLQVIFVLGGLLLVLLMAAFFVFAWPLRKYYLHLCRRMDNKDVESGRYEDGELTSIRVDPSYNPSESGSTAYYPPTQQDPTSTPYQAPYQAPGERSASPGTSPAAKAARVGKRNQAGNTYNSRVPQADQANNNPDQSGEKSTAQIIADDKKRDSRNAERRKIIKQKTSQRRDSLVVGITIAKSVLDGHAKNKQFEKKAFERRRVIKHSSAPGSSTGENNRRMSFAEELQTGCSVIAPNVDHKESLERSKEKCLAGSLVRAGNTYTSRVPQAGQTNNNPDQSGDKSTVQIIADDKKRDMRNAERRKIITQKTSQRRDSLVDSITIAKSVIDGHAKNKQFEKKASERRRVIKHSSASGSSTGGNNRRRMSFAEELQTGCSVIAPNVDHKDSLERSKEKCRKIKDQFAGKRRPSLAEEIGVAKSVIIDNPRRYTLPPNLVKEMIDVGLEPSDLCSYYVMDFSKSGCGSGNKDVNNSVVDKF